MVSGAPRNLLSGLLLRKCKGRFPVGSLHTGWCRRLFPTAWHTFSVGPMPWTMATKMGRSYKLCPADSVRRVCASFRGCSKSADMNTPEMAPMLVNIMTVHSTAQCATSTRASITCAERPRHPVLLLGNRCAASLTAAYLDRSLLHFSLEIAISRSSPHARFGSLRCDSQVSAESMHASGYDQSMKRQRSESRARNASIERDEEWQRGIR